MCAFRRAGLQRHWWPPRPAPAQSRLQAGAPPTTSGCLVRPGRNDSIVSGVAPSIFGLWPESPGSKMPASFGFAAVRTNPAAAAPGLRRGHKSRPTGPGLGQPWPRPAAPRPPLPAAGRKRPARLGVALPVAGVPRRWDGHALHAIEHDRHPGGFAGRRLAQHRAPQGSQRPGSRQALGPHQRPGIADSGRGRVVVPSHMLLARRQSPRRAEFQWHAPSLARAVVGRDRSRRKTDGRPAIGRANRQDQNQGDRLPSLPGKTQLTNGAGQPARRRFGAAMDSSIPSR